LLLFLDSTSGTGDLLCDVSIFAFAGRPLLGGSTLAAGVGFSGVADFLGLPLDFGGASGSFKIGAGRTFSFFGGMGGAGSSILSDESSFISSSPEPSSALSFEPSS